MPRKQPLAYLMTELNGRGDFTAQWKFLSDEEKAQLRDWATQEMDALGM